MLKKTWSLVLAILMCSSMVLGCAKSRTGDEVNNRPDTEHGGAITQAATSEESSADGEVQQEIAYAYEQELNILDDNYRNYYEIFVYSFCDSDGDGIGDFNGITEKLDYIQELGFNGIWLMPIMPSPSYHKYDVTNYYDVDPQYGTLEDFQKLIEECHNRRIRVIIDFVFNHTSARHPWFTEAVSYLETLGEKEEPDPSVCPSVDYYHFTKAYDGSEDYHKAGNSDWYYECVFWDQMPDLALESPELRVEVEKVANYWLELGVDGFRLDAAKEFYTGEPSKNVKVLKWFCDYVTSVNEDAYIVGEVWDEEAAIATYYESGINSLFNFPLAQYNGVIVNAVRKLGTSSASDFAKTVVDMEQEYKDRNLKFIDAPFLSNHDTTRISAQCVNDENQMKMAAGVLLTMSGSPFVYYGEEIGMNSMGDKDENKRLPMQWSLTDKAGMTKGPDAADQVKQKFEPADIQQSNPLSLLNYYKRALRIRNENPEIARGETSIIDSLTTEDVCTFQKTYEGSDIVLIYNMNKEAATLDLKNNGFQNLQIRGYLTVDGSEVTLTDGALALPLYSIVILK